MTEENVVDVVVIGGGAVGLLAAKTMAESGLETVLIEEHDEIGVPEHCAGLYNIRNLEKLGLNISSKYVENIVEGAYFYSPTNRMIHIDAGRAVAVVTSRMELDKFLAQEFERKGGKMILGRRVIDVVNSTDDLLVVKMKDGHEIRAKRVVDAEGMSSIILRRVLRKNTERDMWIPIIQLWIKDHGLDPRYVYIYLEEYLPEFFAYLIPINENLGKLGVASRRNLKIKLNRFLRERFPRSDIIRRTSHAVYTGRPLRIDFESKFIPVGDAAGHVKASTGGGVIVGGLIAEHIAKVISSQLLEGHLPRSHVREIDLLLKELDRIASITRIIRSLPSKLIDKLFKMMDDRFILDEISKRGDMDLQFTSLSRIFMKPSILFRLMLKAII
ncbi:MAG: NAD(P)/FAD-dependent oxidoreductase [Candidatus Caldarchaeales archaeon]